MIQGLGLMSLFGDWFHITKTNICWRCYIPNSWVMFNWDIYQPLLFTIVVVPIIFPLTGNSGMPIASVRQEAVSNQYFGCCFSFWDSVGVENQQVILGTNSSMLERAATPARILDDGKYNVG